MENKFGVEECVVIIVDTASYDEETQGDYRLYIINEAGLKKTDVVFDWDPDYSPGFTLLDVLHEMGRLNHDSMFAEHRPIPGHPDRWLICLRGDGYEYPLYIIEKEK